MSWSQKTTPLNKIKWPKWPDCERPSFENQHNTVSTTGGCAYCRISLRGQVKQERCLNPHHTLTFPTAILNHKIKSIMTNRFLFIKTRQQRISWIMHLSDVFCLKGMDINSLRMYITSRNVVQHAWVCDRLSVRHWKYRGNLCCLLYFHAMSVKLQHYLIISI